MGDDRRQADTARLLSELANGREEAFNELYDRFGTRLFRVAQAQLRNRHDAEDAVQEVFIALIRSRHKLSEVRDLAAYLFAALRHTVARRSVRRAGEPISTEIDVAEQDKTPRDADPRAERLESALAALPPEQRELLALKFEGELTFAEIGGTLGISANTAASRYRYALEKLRGWLKNEVTQR
ncbi:MAG TPA: sigma-70 family RNA polymerase sigma factor [Pirellulales bacterium]|nr:sigma-70 family RNA polymerase sigma factor [Pirellulales bacterium]